MEILIADDDDACRVYLELVVRMLSHTSATARNGIEALELLEHFEFDAVLLDVEMPVMGGIETLQHIRTNPALRDLPVYALTAHSSGPEMERIHGAGFSGCLSKPCSPDTLKGVLDGEGGTRGNLVERAVPFIEPEIYRTYQELLRDAGMSPREAVNRTLAAVNQWLSGQPEFGPASGEEAHSLAGSCAIIGAFALRKTMKELERLADGRDAEQWMTALAKAETVLRGTGEAYRAELNSLRADEGL